MLLSEVQRLNAQNVAQREHNATQQKKIEFLEERLARLESLLEQATARTALQ